MSKVTVDLLRIEGEGKVVLHVDDKGIVRGVEYVFTEPRRFFENIVKRAHYTLIPDLVSRICGLCGVSYVLSAVRALESCQGLSIPDHVEKAREIIHLAERVKSHMIHTAFMGLPEVLSAKSYLEIGKISPELYSHIARSLVLMEKLVKQALGRLHNTIGIYIGGVSLDSNKLASIVALIKHELLPEFTAFATRILEAAEVLRDESQEEISTCSVVSNDYPGSGAKVVIDEFVFDALDFYEKVLERKKRHGDNTYRYLYRGRAFLTGPLVRFNHYRAMLVDETRELLETYSWYRDLHSPAQSIIARIAEVHDALHRMIRYASLIPGQIYHRAQLNEVSPITDCYYVIEAPRGVLYQRFSIGNDERGLDACIIPPTAQNAEFMERYVERLVIGLREKEAVNVARKITVMFDPCLSCSVHSLKINTNTK